MAAAVVLYTLNQTGNLNRELPDTSRNLDKVAKAAKEAKVATKGFDESVSDLGGGLSILSPKVGGAVQGFGALAKGAKVAMGAMAGAGPVAALAAGLVALDAALLGAMYALYKVADAAATAFDRLSEVDKAISSEAAGNIEDYSKGVGKLATAWDKFMVSLGSQPSALLGQFATGLGMMVDQARLLVDQFNRFADVRGRLGESGAMNGPPGLGGVLQPPVPVTGPGALPTPTGPRGGRGPSDLDAAAAGISFMSPAGIATADPWAKVDAVLAVVGAAAEEAAALTPALDQLGSDVTAMGLQMERAADNQARMQHAGDALSAAGGGLGSVIGMAGPLGAAVNGILAILEDPVGFGMGLMQSVIDLYTDLPAQFSKALNAMVPMLVHAIPELVTAFATLGPLIVVELIASLPRIVAAFADFPALFAHEISQALQRFVGSIVAAVDPFRGKGGNVLGTNLTAEAETKKLFGIKLPFLDKGGSITRDGLAFVHKGETVTPAGRGGSGPVNIYATFNGINDIRKIASELQRLTGPFGVGLSLVPKVGG